MGHLRTWPHSLGSFFAAREARRTVRTSPAAHPPATYAMNEATMGIPRRS